MGKTKKTRSKSAGPSAAVGSHAKERHRRNQRGISVGAKDLKGTLEKPIVVSKHKSYYERVVNTEKKLDFEVQQPTTLVELPQLLANIRRRH